MHIACIAHSVFLCGHSVCMCVMCMYTCVCVCVCVCACGVCVCVCVHAFLHSYQQCCMCVVCNSNYASGCGKHQYTFSMNQAS